MNREHPRHLKGGGCFLSYASALCGQKIIHIKSEMQDQEPVLALPLKRQGIIFGTMTAVCG